MTYEEKLAYVSSNSTMVEWVNSFEAYIIKDSLQSEYRPKTPFFASWNITNKCNLACVYCSNANCFTTLQEMSLQEKLKTVDLLIDNGIKHIRLLGGEPSIVTGFPQIIDRILKKNIFLSISTNGVGINDEIVDVLRRFSPYMYKINISCDSCIKENNDINRGAGSYRDAFSAIERLQTIRDIDLTLFSVLTNATKNDISMTYERLKDMGVSGYGLTIALKRGRATDDDIIVASEIIDELLLIMEDSKRDQKTKVFANLGYHKANDGVFNLDLSEVECDTLFRTKCNCCITRIHVESNGDIYPCDHLKYPAFFMGNIIEDEFECIWNNEVSRELSRIRRRDKEECSKCKLKNCSTGCMGLTYEKCGTLYGKDPNCEVLME